MWTRRITLTFCGRPCCQNAAIYIYIQTMISGCPWFRLHARQRSITPRQNNSTFSSKQRARFHQLINTAFARCESARLLSLGYLARTYLRRKPWTVCQRERSSECYQKLLACCRQSDSQNSYAAVENAFSSSHIAEWRTYSTHFLLISWLLSRSGVDDMVHIRATT